MNVSIMTKPNILRSIETLHGVQKSNPPTSAEWTAASLILKDLFGDEAAAFGLKNIGCK